MYVTITPTPVWGSNDGEANAPLVGCGLFPSPSSIETGTYTSVGAPAAGASPSIVTGRGPVVPHYRRDVDAASGGDADRCRLAFAVARRDVHALADRGCCRLP